MYVDTIEHVKQNILQLKYFTIKMIFVWSLKVKVHGIQYIHVGKKEWNKPRKLKQVNAVYENETRVSSFSVMNIYYSVTYIKK